MASLGSHYHVGIVVADLDEARARLTRQLGVVWGPVLRLDGVEYRAADGTDLVLPTAFCYSVGDPCLELIEEQPGTVWSRNEHSNLHHLGFWSDDLGGDGEALAAGGCPLQLCGRAGAEAPSQFAYHRDPDLGVRIEVVDAAMRDVMAFLFEPDPAAAATGAGAEVHLDPDAPARPGLELDPGTDVDAGVHPDPDAPVAGGPTGHP